MCSKAKKKSHKWSPLSEMVKNLPSVIILLKVCNGVVYIFGPFVIIEPFRDFCITKTCLYNFDPLNPHFYIVKLGFTGVYIIFLISTQKNIDCGYSFELPRRGGSNKYLQSMF